MALTLDGKRRCRYIVSFISAGTAGVDRLRSLFRPKAAAKGLTSVVWTGEGVALAHVRDSSSQPELTCCLHIDSRDPLSDVRRFKEAVDANDLSASRTVLVLPDNSYQLLLVERPDVPEEELTQALRWRVKDLVSFDIEEAVLDYFELPDDAYRGRSSMVYVVVAQQSKVDRLVDWCEEIGLNPEVVDVPELALLNLTEDLADSEAGLAVFFIDSRNSSVNLLSDSALYFTRHLSYTRESGPESASAAVLELQRSLDYYESQVGKPPCVRLLVMPVQDESALMEELRFNLPLDIHSLNLNTLIESRIELSQALQQKTTVAVAAALRTELPVRGAR